MFAVAFSVALARTESATYAVFRSGDHGRSWIRSSTGLQRESRVNAFASMRGITIAGTDSGPFISSDSGKTWRKRGITGLTSTGVTSLAAGDGLIYGGISEGVIVSSDKGKSWQVSRAFPRQKVRSLHAAEGLVYVGTDADGIYQSADRGQTWMHLTANLPSPCQVFALTSVNRQLFAGLYAQGLYSWKTTEHKWLRVGADAGIRPLVLASSGNVLIAGHNPGGIYRSLDLGNAWEHWSLSLSTASTANGATANIDPVPAIEAGFPHLDTANSTASLQAPIWEMSANSKLAIAGAGSGIYFSTDRARTWQRAEAGLPPNAPGIAFLVDDAVILAAVIEKQFTSITNDR